MCALCAFCHDGETLGGFPIARKDDIKQPVDFDINTVSDDFWRNIIEKFSQTSFEESKDFSHNDSYVDAIIETNKLPKLIQVEMICKNPDAGYGVSEKVAAFGIGNRANPKPLAFINENGLNLRQMIGGENSGSATETQESQPMFPKITGAFYSEFTIEIYKNVC